MSEATKRLRRKDLREPDEFMTLTGRAIDWSRDNVRVVVGVAGALGVLLVIAGIWGWVHQSREARSAREFYAAQELFKRGQWAPAEKGFDELADSLPGTSYGRLARLYAGRSALRDGRAAEAIVSLREFLSQPIDDPAVEQLAHMNLGIALASQSELDAAREQLTKAQDMDGPARGEATLALARVEEEAGRKDEALQLYQKYLNDDPEAVARDLARARIIALGGTPPALPQRMPAGMPPQISVE